MANIKEERNNAINDLAVRYLERLAIVPNFYADQIINGVKLGAKWADEHPNVDAFIEKAARWISEYTSLSEKLVIEDFRKYMKG